MEVMLSDMGIDATCVSEGACVVETARNLGVDYVASGSVTTLSGTLVASLKLHNTHTGQLLGTQRAQAMDVLGLLDPIAQAGRTLAATLLVKNTELQATSAPLPPATPPPMSAVASAFTPSAWTGSPIGPNHEVYFKPVKATTSNVVTLTMNDSQSQRDFIRVSAKISNTTANQIVVLKGAVAEFALPQGARRVEGDPGDVRLILPQKTRNYTFAAEGNGGFQVDSMALRIKGLSVGPIPGTPVETPGTQLSAGEFTAGQFTCKVSTHKAAEGRTGSLDCAYDGEGIGIVEPGHLSARAPDGKVYPNIAAKVAQIVLPPGDKSSADVTFAFPEDRNVELSQLIWDGVLFESVLAPLPLEDWIFAVDLDRTKYCPSALRSGAAGPIRRSYARAGPRIPAPRFAASPTRWRSSSRTAATPAPRSASI